MNDGWLALCISILKGVSPEVAFKMLDGNKVANRKWTDDDIRDIEELRNKGLSWQKVSEYYGCTTEQIKRIYSYRKGKK